jgi:ABC-2 type transport system ATP-binding protein
VQDFSGQGAGGLGARVRCEVDTDKLDGLLRHLAAAGVLSLVSQPPTLEELFLRHYATDVPDGAGHASGAPRRRAGDRA